MQDIPLGLPTARLTTHAIQRMAQYGYTLAHLTEAVNCADAQIVETQQHGGPQKHIVLGWWENRQPLHIVLGMTTPICIITLWDPSQDPRGRWLPPDYVRRKP